MLWTPPSSTYTDTLFPYTTLCRSRFACPAVSLCRTMMTGIWHGPARLRASVPGLILPDAAARLIGPEVVAWLGPEVADPPPGMRRFADRKSTRLNPSHPCPSRMPVSAWNTKRSHEQQHAQYT